MTTGAAKKRDGAAKPPPSQSLAAVATCLAATLEGMCERRSISFNTLTSAGLALNNFIIAQDAEKDASDGSRMRIRLLLHLYSPSLP
jgi:hypothetical protein